MIVRITLFSPRQVLSTAGPSAPLRYGRDDKVTRGYLDDGNVIQVGRGGGEVGGGGHAGEGLEVVDEMGLVVVAAIECDLCPIDLPGAMYRVEGLLEAAHAAEGFRRESDLLAKELDETARAEADFFRECSDGGDVRRAANVMERIGYGWVPLQWARELREQVLFEDSEHCCDGGGGEHALAELGGSCAPEIVKCDRCIFHLIDGRAEEGECASRVELDADDTLLLRGVDDEVIGAGAGDDGVSVGVEVWAKPAS